MKYIDPAGNTVTGQPVTRTFYGEPTHGGYALLPAGTDPAVAAQLKTRQVAADGTITLYGYDTDGITARQPNRIVVLDGEGAGSAIERRYTYDTLGRLATEVMPEGIRTGDLAGYMVQFGYDPNGLLASIDKPGTADTTTTYTAWGDPATTSDPNGPTVYAYDLTTGRLTSVTDPAGHLITHSYHPATGLPADTTDSSGSIGRIYDTWGRVVSQTDATGATSTFVYDAESNLISRGDLHATTSYQVDPQGRTTTIIDPAGTVTYSYGTNESLGMVSLPNGIVASYTARAGTGDLDTLTYTDPAGTAIGAFDRDYDAAGRVIIEHRPAGERHYRYDPYGRLVQAVDHDGGGTVVETRGYSYDHNTNRTSKTVTDATGTPVRTEAYGYDTADRLQTRAIDSGTPQDYSYDAAGNTLAGDGRGYRWTTTNRLAGIDLILDSQQVAIDYTLDPLGRTLTRTDTRDNIVVASSTHHYADDTDLPTWTTDFVDGIETVTRHVAGPTGLVATHTVAGSTSFPLASPHGDIWATTDAAGTVDTTTDHEEFGVQTVGGPARYGWTGQQQRETDRATGIILMGVRPYQPDLGRFLSVDPVYGGSANSFEYAAQDPVVNTDLTGEALDPRSGGGGRFPARWMTRSFHSSQRQAIRAAKAEDKAKPWATYRRQKNCYGHCHVDYRTRSGRIYRTHHYYWTKQR